MSATEIALLSLLIFSNWLWWMFHKAYAAEVVKLVKRLNAGGEQ